MKLWYGREREGFLKGVITLFVGSDALSYDEIIKLSEGVLYQQIYFGAGVCSKINYDAVRQCVSKLETILLTLEVDINDLHNVPQDIAENPTINFIVTTTNKNYSLLPKMNKNSVQMKIQSLEGEKVVYVGELRKFSSTDVTTLQGKMYEGDKVLL